jgi:hypothetical protein
MMAKLALTEEQLQIEIFDVEMLVIELFMTSRFAVSDLVVNTYAPIEVINVDAICEILPLELLIVDTEILEELINFAFTTDTLILIGLKLLAFSVLKLPVLELIVV